MPVWNKSSIPAELSPFRAVKHNFNGLWTRPPGWERGRASLCIFHGYAIRRHVLRNFPSSQPCAPLRLGAAKKTLTFEPKME